MRPSTPDPRQAPRQTVEPGLGYLYPLDLPMSSVSVGIVTSKPQIGLLSSSLWTTVEVSADVSSVPFPGTSGLAPLDVIILLDSL